MNETGIGRAVNIHLHPTESSALPGDASETSRYFKEDLVEPGVVLDEKGFIAVPPGPGLGVRVLPERLERCSLGTERLL